MNSERVAFGPKAESLAQSLDAESPVIVFERGSFAAALREASMRRARGERFYVRPLLQRTHSALCDAAFPLLAPTFQSLDDRLNALDLVLSGQLIADGKPLSQHVVYSAQLKGVLRTIVRLADGIAVSSESERRRVVDIIGGNPAYSVVKTRDEMVPEPLGIASARDAIVLWGPHESGTTAWAFALALRELRVPIIAVSATPLPDSEYATWLSPARGAEALARARVIVDLNDVGCDAALPLAAWGVPLVVDVESGGQEWYSSVRTYSRSSPPSIFDAVIEALGAIPPVDANPDSSVAARTIVSASASASAGGPLVSVLVQTFNRPHTIRNTLESLRRQTYRNIQTVVVIDGGPPIDDVATEFPEVLFEHLPVNNNYATGNRGFALTKGEYICILNDDDVFFPNHIELLVAALERSGLDVAHGDVLTVYLEGKDADWTLYGFDCSLWTSVDKSRMLVNNRIGIMSCMFRRSLIENETLFDGTIPEFGDYAIWLRLIADHDFVHVERTTSVFTVSNGGAQQQSTMASEGIIRGFKRVYDLYPVERPSLQRKRQEHLAILERGDGFLRRPTVEVDRASWPLWKDQKKQ